MKWALIGCGDLANKRVASALKRARNSELLCVFARNPENTAAFAQRHGIRQVCASFDDVLRQGIDAVYICTPPATHADYAIRAMQAGKHVLVEKPMASNATECRAMLACADKCGMRLGVAYYRRTHPKTLKIKELIDQGILGTPTWVNVVCHSWYAPSKDATNAWRVRPGESGGAGALADIGVHRLDLLDYWFGPLKPRYCNSHRLVQDYDVEDGTSAVLELNNGAPVHLYFAWNSKTWMDRIEIVGSEAKLIADPLDSPSLKILRGREWEELTLPPPENAHLPCVEDFITAAEAGRDALSSGRAAARTNLLLESLVGGSRAPQLSSWGRPAPIAVGIGLVPKPHNDFPEFIRTYFERCRERNPLIEANTGKWTSEDLIPGLSDFDTRFIVADSTAAQDWCRMSMDVARVHLDLVRERPEWARNLEHLPGVNLRWRELGCEFWFPEFRQWTFYFGELERLNAARKYIASRPWSSEDDLFHWKKLAAYYGPYDRSIDAPINLGPYENKYPLHSRIMHYFAPAVQSAVALMEQRCGAGKIDALKRARELFPHAEVIDDVLRIIDLHYECPDELSPRGLDLLDARLEEYLARATEVLLHARPLDGCSAKPTRAELSRAVARLQRGDSANSVFENVRFARLMKGRLWFYSQDVLWFDSLPLIRNELNRIHKNFFEAPVTIAARLLCRENSNALAALDTLTGSILTRAEADACREFAELAGAPCENRDLKQRAAEIADCFEPFLTAIESLLEALAKRKAEQQSAQNWPRRGSECQKSHVNTAG